MDDLLSFEDALRDSTKSKRHLLLGNGFSIGWSRDAFSYDNLRQKADLGALSCDGDALFDALGTNDFEVVIDRLEGMRQLLKVYEPGSPLIEQVASDAATIRESLAVALAGGHPDHVGAVAAPQYEAARCFLQHFKCVYSLNYDLLLYWSTLQDEIDDLDVVGDDGFRDDPDEEDADWVTWDNVGSRRNQTVHYLHGALHLFDAGDRLKKITWKRTAIALLEQVRIALDRGEYPLVVTEGTSREKLQKIDHSAYLSGSFRSFGNIQNTLFIYGHGLADSDDHILDLVTRGKVSDLYVSLYGDPDSRSNRLIRLRAQQMSDQRANRTRGKRPLNFRFFDAHTANVWG